MVRRSLAIVAAVGVTAAASGSSTASALAGELGGEVKANVSLPPGQQRAHHRFIPVQAVVSVTVTPENGGVVLHEMIFTNTKMMIWVPVGRYAVSAEIGPPTVNPQPRKCGKAQVAVGKKAQANFMLKCPLR
jgi:hypothetical protein